MNWSDIGKTLAGLGLPALGTALVGPIGGVVGSAIAEALGVDNSPDAVNSAIAGDPASVREKLAEADAKWAEAQTEMAKSAATQSSAINETIRSEQGTISWWHWRHLLGYVVGGWCVGIAGATTKLIWTADAVAIGNIVPLLNSVWGYFGAACGLLGYVAMDNTRRTSAAQSGQPIPTLVGTIANIFGKKG